MSNNIAVRVTADTADLTSKMIQAQVSITDYGKTARDVARQVLAGDTSPETKQRFLEVSEAVATAKNQLATYKQAMARIPGDHQQVSASAGAVRAGMQSLSYQINDVATMFALGAPPMQIFASQGSQIIQALQGMNGGAKGLLGVLGGPWGTAMIVAATALTPFISKLLETGDAADAAKQKVYGLRDALADMRTKPMESLGKLQGNVWNAEGALRKAEAMPRYTGGGSETYKKNTFLERQRDQAIKDARTDLAGAQTEFAVAKAIEKTNQSLFDIRTKAGRLRATAIDHDDGDDDKKKKGGRKGSKRAGKKDRSDEIEAKKAAQEAERLAREELQNRLDDARVTESIAEDKVGTEIELSRIALDAKLEDIEAEQRAGQISDATALQRKVVLNNQMIQLDKEYENRVYEARLKQLEDEQKNYKEGTSEFRGYLRRKEELTKQHENRLLVIDAQANAKRRQMDRLADTESNRRMSRMAGTWASNLARMATLQQGFGATVKGIWQGMVGVVTDVIEQIVEQWIVGELIKIGLMKLTSQTGVASEAAKAGAAGTASMAGAPFPINTTAPAFGASMYAAAQAYSSMPSFAQGTNELPRDMVAQIHAGERIIPKADNAALLEMTKRGAMGPMGSQPPFGAMPGGGGGGDTHVHLHGTVIHGVRALKKFAEANAPQLSAAGRKYVRNNGRG